MRTPMLVCLVMLITALLFAGPARATVMGIDLGSEFIKVAAPKNKGIDIVLNEQSNRKSSNYIGFRGDERYFGDDARNLAPRFPDNMFTFINNFVGVAFNNTERIQWLKNDMKLKFNIEESARMVEDETDQAPAKKLGTLALRTGGNPDVAYHAEALLGMLFTYIRDMVAKDTGIKVRDAIVTVPGYFDIRQRQAIIDSAALAGVNVVGTMHSTTAFALQRGHMVQGFGNETVTVMIFDMGTSHTDIGVYEYQPPPEAPKGNKKKPRNAEFYGTMVTKSLVSDYVLSGRALDVCLAQLIEDRFVEATKLPRVLGGETLAQRKAIIALMRAANKAKEMLTANKKANIVAEGMAPGRDFPTVITREEFEERCSSLFRRVVVLAEEAAHKANTTIASLDFLEIAGGVSRIPRIANDLSELRGKPVEKRLNGDEAAAIGAAFYGGIVTNRFPALKSFAVKEDVFVTRPRLLNTSISFALSPKKGGDEIVFRPLFSNKATLQQVKAVSINRTEEFNITIAYSDFHDGEWHHTPDYLVKITGIKSALESLPYYKNHMSSLTAKERKMLAELDPAAQDALLGNMTELNHPNNSHFVRIEFRASESGIFTVASAELRVSYMSNVSKWVSVNMTDDEIAQEEKRLRDDVIAREVLREQQMQAAAKKYKKTKTVDPNTTADDNDTDASQNASSTAENVTSADDEVQRKIRIEAAVQRALKTMKRTKQVRITEEQLVKSGKPLKFRLVHVFPSPLTKLDKKRLKGVLEEFDFADEQRRLKSKAKNDLDAYLVWTRGDGVLDNDAMKSAGVLTPEAEAAIREAVSKVQGWLDDDATDDTPTDDYVAKLAEIKLVVGPVEKAFKSQMKGDTTPPASTDDAASASNDSRTERDAESTDDENTEDLSSDKDSSSASSEKQQEEEGAGEPEEL